MTDRAQFEAMLEALINEDQEAARDIFHNIVVAKSREIYEELLSEDFGAEDDEESDTDSEEDSEEDDSEADDEEGEENPFGDEEEGEENPFGDEEDDMMGGEDDGDLEDRVLDLEDALDELKSEFEQLMAGEEDEPEHDDMFGGDDDMMGGEDDMMGGDEFGADDAMSAAGDKEFQEFMEYVNKVALPKHGDNGVNNKSVIDNMKNDMGGTTANILNSFSTDKGGTQGGLLDPSTKPQTGNNINVPGAKSATNLKQVPKGHGAEKKGSGDNGVNTRDTLPRRGSK